MFQFDNAPVPSVTTPPPGPKAQALLSRDKEFVSPSYTRIYPLVVESAAYRPARSASISSTVG